MSGFDNPYIGAATVDPRQAMSGQMNDQQKKKPWWTSLISELGGAGGAAGGAAAGAAAGSIVPGLGTAVGGLIGAAAGGFLGGTGGRVVENEVRDNRVGLGDAFKEGAVSGILGAGPGQLLKVAKGGTAALDGGAAAFSKATAGVSPEDLLKTSSRGKLYDKGNELLSAQYGTISKPVARQTDALNTISKLADYGITKPQDAERIARGFTGANGITNKAVLSAVGDAGKVNLSALEGGVDTALSTNGVVGNPAKSVKAFVMGQLGRAEDPSAVDPKTALDIMRNIEGQTAEVLGKGGTYHLATTNNVLQSKALRDIHQTVGDALYDTAGANANVKNVLTPGFRDELMKLNPGNSKWQKFVDDKVMGSKSVADLRSTMAPFVRISKVIDEGDTNAMTFGGRLANPLAGASLGGALLGLGGKVIKDPASRFSGNALRAGATAGIGPIEAPTIKGITQRIALSAANPNALLHPGAAAAAASGPPTAVPTQDPNSLLTGAAGPGSDATSSLLGQANGGDATAALLGQPQQQTQGGPSLQSLQQAIQQDIQTNGGKGINQLMQLGQLYGIVDSSGNPVTTGANGSPANVGKVSAQAYGLAQQGNSALNQLAQLVQADPGVVNRTATPGRGLPVVGGLLGNLSKTSDYDTLGFATISSLLRAQSGAAVPDSEVKSYMRAYLPRPGDTPDVIKRKLQTIQYNFQSVLSQGQGMPSSSPDLLDQTNGVQ